jgi:hypothetical protein
MADKEWRTKNDGQSMMDKEWRTKNGGQRTYTGGGMVGQSGWTKWMFVIVFTFIIH